METIAAAILPYLATIIGFLIVWILNGIKAEIKEIKTSVNSLEEDIRSQVSGLEHRVTVLETGCAYIHGKEHNE